MIIPLSLLYNLDALLVISYPFDIVCDLSIVQLTLVLLSLIVSIVLGLLFISMYSIIKKNGVKIFYKVVNAASVIIILGYTINYFKRWLIITYDINPFYSKGILVLIIFSASVIIIFIFNKYSTAAANKKRLNELFKGVMVIIITGSVLLTFKAVADSFHSYSANTDVSRKSQTGNKTINRIQKEISKSLPNIILVTFDALAAEDMSLYGYHIKTTPNIDALAKESYVFDTMIANSNWTRPSAASILTGKYPITHNILGINNITRKMIDNTENIAGVLRRGGYKTAAVTSNFYTHPLQNMTFRDFDYLPDVITNSAHLPLVETIISIIPSNVKTYSTFFVLLNDIFSPLDRILNMLLSERLSETPWPPDLTFESSLKFILNTKSPFFIWIHILPPRKPYLPSKRFKYKLLEERIFNGNNDSMNNLYINGQNQYQPDQQYLVDKLRLRYNENIMYADDAFGNFVKVLSTKGIYDNSVLIVSSDHGESFRKGYIGHGGNHLEKLYQQFIRIPLIIHMPKQQIGKRIKSNAEHVDLAPTILDLLNIDVPRWMEGESLNGAMYHNQITKRPKYSMNLLVITDNKPIPKGAIAIIKENYKYIFQTKDNRGELYDIKNDPYENNNLVSIEKDIAEELKQLITRKLYHGEKKTQ